MPDHNSTIIAPAPCADQDALLRLGESVRARLTAHQDVYRVPVEAAEIYAVGNFLDEVECVKMCTMIDAVVRPSSLYELDYSSGYRTSYSGDLDPHDTFVMGISRRNDDMLGVPPECCESIQGQRYLPGQQFKPHNDWFDTAESYWPQEEARGGQRSWTAMVYLNDVTAGGETAFTELGIKIHPQRGALILWNNALQNGKPNEATLHAGTSVEQGVKYVITKWYRTPKWR